MGSPTGLRSAVYHRGQLLTSYMATLGLETKHAHMLQVPGMGHSNLCCLLAMTGWRQHVLG